MAKSRTQSTGSTANSLPFDESFGNHPQVVRRALSLLALDAAILRAGRFPSFARMAPVMATRGFLSSIWKTFDECPPVLSEVVSGNRKRLARIAGFYREQLAQAGLDDPRLEQSRGNAVRHAVTTGGSFKALAGAIFEDDAAALEAPPEIEWIEAPGDAGEARMVARRIVVLRTSGVSLDRIIIASRTLDSDGGLLASTLREYGISCRNPVCPPFGRAPAVRALLAFRQIPQNGWTFREIGAMLRSNYFRPNWPEFLPKANFLREVEQFLRFLNEPAGRSAFESALEKWTSTDPPAPLEDEDMEVYERAKMQRIALEVRPFLLRLFETLAARPERGTVAEHAAALRRLERQLGIATAVGESVAEWKDWRDFLAILDALPRPPQIVSRARFDRILDVVTRCETGPAPQAEGVWLLPPEEAAGRDCNYLFAVGLGEGGYPKLSPPDSLYTDRDRLALIAEGYPLPDPRKRLEAERELFRNLIRTPKTGLIFSRSAVDAKGQRLLPSSFLSAAMACFKPNSPIVKSRRMPIDGYLVDPPYSPAERRVQYAAKAAKRPAEFDWSWAGDCSRTIGQAAVLAEARLRDKSHSAYDGLAISPAAVAKIAAKFGEDKVFSPTSLETYVACPFRFLMEQVLRLEKLEEPTDEIEVWRRGMAFHRALSRLHGDTGAQLNPADPNFRDQFDGELEGAIGEYQRRSFSPFTRKLWELEGQRLRRLTRGYDAAWAKFRSEWQKVGSEPRPQFVERAFGYSEGFGEETKVVRSALKIQRGETVVQLGGKIDRIDTAELRDGGTAFWIIDYKTGSPAKYSAASFAKFERLQLTLYALAAQRLFFGETPARPFGMAYWFVAHEKGLKTVYPEKDKAVVPAPQPWIDYTERLEEWVTRIVGSIRQGLFPLAPRTDKTCESCPYSRSCRIAQGRGRKDNWKLVPGEATRG